MMLFDDAQHFVRQPDWTWYILFYFFFAGLSGGSYFLASLLRLFGKDVDEPAARVGYYVSFGMLLPCPVLLTLDLGKPQRFWHMLVNTTPGSEGIGFKYWSPMSVGAWALTVFGAFATVSALEVFVRDRWNRRPPLLDGPVGKVWTVIGGLLALFVAGYTGVLLSVSNQPVWSDTWTLGGLFLASGLSGSAALLGWLMRFRRDAKQTVGVFSGSERMFQILEAVLIVAFALTLIQAGAFGQAFGLPWLFLWIIVALALLTGVNLRAEPRANAGAAEVAYTATWAVVLVLVGLLALRAAIIFSVH